ncbi:MAG: PQQ-dependent sugar dehydrogenase, partial [Anaerolineales bacterium]
MRIISFKKSLPYLLLGASFLLFILAGRAAAQQDDPDWKRNWGVVEGFSIEIDTEGYDLPSAIAFIPEPGAGPKDPLYFVTELRGTIKVVTNDRTVYTFAENFFETDPQVGLDVTSHEYGMAGICLAPEEGYVFVSYTYLQNGKLYNAIARFETRPGTFAVEYSDITYFTELFEDFPTDVSHQIGGCQVRDGFLFVGVGDSRLLFQLPLGLDTPLGKVLRMTLDGLPVEDNPFYQDENPRLPENFIWAYGFRNPFGLKMVDGRLFLAENGESLDRFVEVLPGEDYLWDGTDNSIGSRSIATFFPPIGPAQMDFARSDFEPFPPDYRDSFYIAMSSRPRPGIMSLRLKFASNELISVPEPFLTYNGPTDEFSAGVIAALGVGPDGLYFAPVLPSGRSTTAVYKITYDPSNAHPYLPGGSFDAEAMLHNLGCLGCHSLDGLGGTYGPNLDYEDLQARLSERLNSPAYVTRLDEIDEILEEPYASYREERQQVRTLQGINKQKAWLIYHLLEPKFDNPNAAMPNLGLNRAQAEVLATFLLRARMQIPSADQALIDLAANPVPTPPLGSNNASGNGPFGFLYGLIPPARYRYVVAAFLLGLGLGLAISSPDTRKSFSRVMANYINQFRQRLRQLRKLNGFHWTIVCICLAAISISPWLPFGLNIFPIADGWRILHQIQLGDMWGINGDYTRFFLPLPQWIGSIISPGSFVGANIMLILLSFGRAVVAYAILRRLLPQDPSWAFLTSALVTFYPSDKAFFILGTLDVQFHVFTFLVSFYLLIRYRENPTRILLVLMWLALSLTLWTRENAIPLIMASPLFFLLMPNQKPRMRTRNVLLAWYSPLILYLIHRAILITATGSLIGNRPGVLLVNPFREVLRGFYLLFTRQFWDSWISILHQRLRWEFLVISVSIALICLIGTLLLDQETKNNSKSKSRFFRHMILGIAVIFLGYLPYAFTVYYLIDYRTYMLSLLGSAIAISALLKYYGTRFFRGILYSGSMVALILIMTYAALSNQQNYANATNHQSEILRQIVMQAPNVQDGTLFLLLLDPGVARSPHFLYSPYLLTQVLHIVYSDYNIYGSVLALDGTPGESGWEVVASVENEEFIFHDNQGPPPHVKPESPSYRLWTNKFPVSRVVAFRVTESGDALLLEEIPSDLTQGLVATGYSPHELINSNAKLPARACTIFPKEYALSDL